MYRRQYGSTDPIYFFMWAPDGTELQSGADLDAGDLQISKDGGSFTNVAGTFTGIGSGLYRYVPVSADLQCRVACLKFVDADGAVLDKPLIVETEGHALAMHPTQDVPFNYGVLDGTHSTTTAQFSSGTKPAQVPLGSLLWNGTRREGRPVTGYTVGTGIVEWSSTLPLDSAWSDADSVYVFPGTPVDGVDVALIDGEGGSAAKLNQIVDDLVNGGRLDLLLDAIKARTDNLPGSPAASGDVPSVGAIADAVWDEPLVGHQVAGTAGDTLTDTRIDVISIKSSTDNLPGSPAATGDIPSAGSIADAVWDEAISGHQGAGSAGEALVVSAPSAASIRAEIDANSTQFNAVLSAINSLEDLSESDVQSAAAAAVASMEPVSADLTQVGGQNLIDGMSLVGLFRILLAYVAGDTTGFDADTPQFWAVDGSKARLGATQDVAKNRTVNLRDGS